jgi:diguanylate cyclase (GGDEF)-like protein
MANTLQTNIRKSDIAGRLGGEEFIVFFPSIKKGDSFSIAEKIRKSIETTASPKIPVTISIGVSEGKITSDILKDLQSIIEQADSALYEAKKRGKNQTFIYQSSAR